MQPCLLLALALLGTATASRPAPAIPEVAALEAPAEDARCPLKSETQEVIATNPLGATTFRYVIVTSCQTFDGAKLTCVRCYGGRLASVHSYLNNAGLRRQAQLCTNRGQIWIRTRARATDRTGRCHGRDWTRSCRYCTSLCTNNGRQRKLPCRVRLPFICQY